MSEFRAPVSQQEVPLEWSDLDVEWVFRAITAGDDVRVVSDSELMRPAEASASSDEEPTLEDIFYHLVDEGYNIEEIEVLHGLAMGPNGAVSEISYQHTSKLAEVIYEI